jgi:hypothetical protein
VKARRTAFDYRKTWLPRLPMAPVQCASCPFKKDNDEQFGAIVNALRVSMGMPKLVGRALIRAVAWARLQARGDADRGGEFACHLSVYESGTMKAKPTSEHRQCPGAAARYRGES